MIKKFKVIPVPTKDNTGIVLITQGVCSGSLVKKEYYGMLQEDMGDTYVHLIGIGEETIEKGDTVFNLNTKEIYKCKEEYGVECEKVILFSTDSSLAYERKFEYKIPTIHRSTYTGLIQQHNHREGMWLDVLMEKPEHPERTDDVHLDAVNFNHWLDIKDKWFIRTFNNIVVVKGEVSEITHPNNVATNYIQDSKIKGDDARMVSRAFKAGMDYLKTKLPPDWNDAQKAGALSRKPKTFDEWYSENTIPEEVKNAIDYCSVCENDLGFMGSPEYYRQKEIIKSYYTKS